MRTFLAAVVGCVLLIVSAVDATGMYTGSKLKQLLDDQDGYVYQAAGTGYVTGVYDSIRERFACVPKGVEVSQLKLIVRKYLNENPEQLHLTASDLITKALSIAFPCRK